MGFDGMTAAWEVSHTGPVIMIDDSVGNSCQSTSPRPTTLEEDRELFVYFLQFYVYGLRFKAWGPTTLLTEFQTLIDDDDFIFHHMEGYQGSGAYLAGASFN